MEILSTIIFTDRLYAPAFFEIITAVQYDLSSLVNNHGDIEMNGLS